MDYPAALTWLYATQLTGIKLGLETIGRLLAANSTFPTDGSGPRILHVAGTNGKGFGVRDARRGLSGGGLPDGTFHFAAPRQFSGTNPARRLSHPRKCRFGRPDTHLQQLAA